MGWGGLFPPPLGGDLCLTRRGATSYDYVLIGWWHCLPGGGGSCGGSCFIAQSGANSHAIHPAPLGLMLQLVCWMVATGGGGGYVLEGCNAGRGWGGGGGLWQQPPDDPGAAAVGSIAVLQRQQCTAECCTWCSSTSSSSSSSSSSSRAGGWGCVHNTSTALLLICPVLCCAALHCFVLRCTVVHCTVLHGLASGMWHLAIQQDLQYLWMGRP